LISFPILEKEQIYLSVAEKAAKTSGEYLRQVMNSNIQIVKQLARDVKLEVDLKSESIIINILKKESDFPILTEERGLINVSNFINDSEYQWIVDPLDGSLNFSRNIPICCVSIALWKDAEPLLGVIYDFNRNEIFTGSVNKGAWLNGQKISTNKVKEKSKAILATGFPVSTDFSKDALLDFVEDVRSYMKIRLFGSAALSLAYVSCGRADVYKENSIKIWDVAAGLALVKAAGGKIVCNGYPESNIVNASGSSTSLII